VAPDPAVLLDFLGKMEFRTLTKRIADGMGVAVPAIPDTDPSGAEPAEGDAPKLPPIDRATYEVVRDAATLAAWIDRAMARGEVAIDTETTGLNEMTADLVGVARWPLGRGRRATFP
jgi:DNA polymerase I